MAYYAGGAAPSSIRTGLVQNGCAPYNGGVEGSYISLPFGDGQLPKFRLGINRPVNPIQLNLQLARSNLSAPTQKLQ